MQLAEKAQIEVRARISALVVEDNDAQRKELVRLLQDRTRFEGYTIDPVMEATNGQEALILVDRTEPGIVLLDYNLFDGTGHPMNGDAVCKAMRMRGISCPIIMLTGARTRPEDVVEGLNWGASEYLRKPYDAMELAARIQNQLRIHEKSEDATLRIGPFRFKPSGNWIESPSTGRIFLTEKESGILKYLHRARGVPVTKETLLAEVWFYNPAVATHTLETHIYRLRRKLETDPKNPKILLTRQGGYGLAA